MADLKLTYFDFPGSRGEECRLALHLAKVAFDDDRVPGAQWPTRKPETPFGVMPVLEVAGKGKLSQTNAILCYLGREYGLHPTDSWQAAKHEELMCACEDLRSVVGLTMRIPDAGEKQARREELAQTTIPAWGANMERLLGDGPFVGGSAIHVADLKIFMMLRWFRSGALDHIPTTVLDDCPKLHRVYQAVEQHPAIVQWYARAK